MRYVVDTDHKTITFIDVVDETLIHECMKATRVWKRKGYTVAFGGEPGFQTFNPPSFPQVEDGATMFRKRIGFK